MGPRRMLRLAPIILFFCSLVSSALFCPFPALSAAGNISETAKYSWSETSGWLNFASAHGGVTIKQTHLVGFVWAANIGWIKLGSDNGGPYENTLQTNWGVNRDDLGNLSGYGWSETVGWINFNPSHSQVTIDPVSGNFDGYAWSANRGYIHFASSLPAYGVSTTLVDSDGDLVLDDYDICANGDDRVDSDGDAVPDHCDPCPTDNPDDTDFDGTCDSVDDFPSNPLYSTDSDEDGMPDIWELEFGLDPAVKDENDDADLDGLSNLDEFESTTFPDKADSDNDGLSDLWEITFGTDPLECRVYADTESDSDVDGENVAQFIQSFFDGFLEADVNKDGLIDASDIENIAASFGRTDLCLEYQQTQ